MSKRLNILIACEESQAITTRFRERGHICWSCDLVDCSGGHPEWHINSDCSVLLNGNCQFTTQDGKTHQQEGKWDLIIAHPPCTYLTVTGNRWFDIDKYGDKARQRYKDRDEAADFFMLFTHTNCEHYAIENPIGYMSTFYRKPNQIIQPYMFGDPARKATCLWTKGLPNLKPTNVVEPVVIKYKNGKGTDNPWHVETLKLPKEERARERSKTFPGIADAIVSQWGSYLENLQ